MVQTTAIAFHSVLRVLTGSEAATLCDRDLLVRFATQGDQVAFATLVTRHAGMVLGVCRRTLTHAEDAEDACQTVFLLLARKAGSPHWQHSIANWLHAVARKVARNALVSASRRTRREERVAVVEAHVPEDPLSGREFLGILDEELDRLAPRYREPLVLCCLEGLTRDEAAHRLGIPRATLKGQLERARKKLAQALAKRGWIPGTGLLLLGSSATEKVLSADLLTSLVQTHARRPPESIQTLAQEFTMNEIMIRVKRLAAATLGALMLGLGLASVLTAATPHLAAPEPEEALPVPMTAEEHKPFLNSITGNVLGPEGSPMAGANIVVIRLRSGGGVTPLPVGITGADGTFRGEWSGDPAHASLILATKEGFGVAWEELHSLPRRSESKIIARDKVTLRLVRDQPIEGQVVDTQGKPLAGVTVGEADVIEPLNGDLDKLLKSSVNGMFGKVGQWEKVLPCHKDLGLGQATTDTEGRFRILGLGADRIVFLRFTGPGLARQSGFIVTRPGVDVSPLNARPAGMMATRAGLRSHPVFYPPKLTCVLERGFSVEGRVTYKKTGKPLPGCQLVANTGFWDHLNVKSDAIGFYRIEGLTPGISHYLSATPPQGSGVFPTWIEMPKPEGVGKVKLDLALVQGALFRGRAVEKGTNKPVSVELQLRPTPDNPYAMVPEFESATRDLTWKASNSDGHFEIVTLPGKSTVLVQSVPTELFEGQPFSPYRTGMKMSIDLKPEGNEDYRIEIERGQEVDVKVVSSEGKPVNTLVASGLTVTDHGFLREGKEFRIGQEKTSVTVYGLGDDEARPLVVVQPEKKLAGAATIRPGATKPLVLHKLMPIRGRFTDTSGSPLVGLKVALRYENGSVGRLLSKYTTFQIDATTNAEGRFQIADVVPGVPFVVEVTRGTSRWVGTPRIGIREANPGSAIDLGTRILELSN